MWKTIIIFFVLLVKTVTISAQDIKIQGYVLLENQTQHDSINITLNRYEPSSGYNYFLTTDGKGYYSTYLPTGSYHVTFDKDGYYISGYQKTFSTDTVLDSIILKEANVVFNPFFQNNYIYDQLNCYGGGDYDGNGIGQEDVDAAQTGLQDDRLDVNGDGIVDGNDATILQEYINGTKSKLPSWWNFLNKEEKVDWLDKMLAIDQTDTITYRSKTDYPKNWFISGNYGAQICLNFDGFPIRSQDEKELISLKYDTTTFGRYNIPVYHVASSGHGMNACLVGDNPLDFYDWQFIEPQYSQYSDLRNFGENWNPEPGTTVTINALLGLKEKDDMPSFPAPRMISFVLDSTNQWNLDYTYYLFEVNKPSVSVENDYNRLNTYILNQNYPNPFNSITTISYVIPNETDVIINIYDLLGNSIKQIISSNQSIGKHTIQWYGRDKYGELVPAGIYLYQIKTGEFVQTKKMILLK